jgi:L-malate glycosyltransferase
MPGQARPSRRSCEHGAAITRVSQAVRILHLTTFLQGGAGRVIALLAGLQRASGHEVVVVTSATPEPGYGNYSGHMDALARAGVAVHAVDSSFKRDTTDNLRVVDFVERHYGGAAGFDLMHTHAAVPSRIAMTLRARAATRIPVLQTMHGWGVTKTPDQQAADVAVLQAVDRVVVTAATSAALLGSLGVPPTRVRIVPCGVPTHVERSDATDGLRAEMRSWQARGGVVICCAGTVGPRKNQRLLVEALPLLDDAGRVLCVFVGDGDTAALEDLATLTGVGPRVRVTGYREDARQIVAASDYLVLPSLSEGQPLSILEAFCDGVPVLASAVPELSELVADGATGFVFDPLSATDLASAFSRARRLSTAARAELCDRARVLWEARFSLDRMCDSYMAEYRALCAGSAVRASLQFPGEIAEQQ